MSERRFPVFLNEALYAVGPLNHTLFLATVWLNDLIERYERKVAGEWPYEKQAAS